ncbi:MAG: VPLPA-CTERM-specific exosortase XrtD [Deltaproteobacteria bacterium]|nr:VPLPA-CTERM-specific exosortase XrtD [Deltaproteobacteria bacterium]
MPKHIRILALLAVFVGCLALLYHDVVARLVTDWIIDENYSHGFLIVPVALYLAWERRHRLQAAPRRPSNFGIALVLLSIAILIAGELGAELFLTRISLLGTLAGVVLFLCGWHWLKILAFPLAFLILMIPIPSIIFNQIAFPLQLFAARLGEISLLAFGVPVLREGNLIILATTTLEVVDACSGIRSLVSLLTLAILYGYFMERRPGLRVAIAVAAIPIAIFTNGFRLFGTGVGVHYYGPQAAEDFFHTFSGWIIFVTASVLIVVLHRLLLVVFPLPSKTENEEQPKRGVAEENGGAERLYARIGLLTIFLIISGIYVHGTPASEAVTVRAPLSAFPAQIGNWRGQPTLQFSDKIVATLGVTDYLSQYYRKPDGPPVHLYVGYYQSQRHGETMHSPKNCLPGSGWQPVATGRIIIPLANGAPIEVNRYLIQKGTEKQLVLYWYQSHGRVVASEYWAKVHLVWDAIRLNRTDGALVRVISPIAASEEAAERQAVEFVKMFFPHLSRHLPV